MTRLGTERGPFSHNRPIQTAIVEGDPDASHSTHFDRGQLIERTASYFEVRDLAAVGFAAVMTLGPLFAYAVGWGA
jgi:hypothetical protein